MLFAGSMVRAEIEGRKTMTRRAMKPQPDEHHWSLMPSEAEYRAEWRNAYDRRWLYQHRIKQNPEWGTTADIVCPYGQPGDLLWVREAHSIFDTHGQHRTDGKRWGPWGGLPTRTSPDGTQIAYYREGFDRCDPRHWRPSIHMPRWASRLTLRITDVRVERLQDISEEDAVAEGINRIHHGDGDHYYHAIRTEPHPKNWVDPVDAFRELWQSINGLGSWATNDWVWALTFEVIHANVDNVIRASQ